MIRPLGNRLLVRFVKKDEEIGSLKIVYDEALKSHEGIVISAGEGVKSKAILNSTSPVTVYYSKFAGQPVKYKGEELIMVTEDEILGYEVQE